MHCISLIFSLLTSNGIEFISPSLYSVYGNDALINTVQSYVVWSSDCQLHPTKQQKGHYDIS